MTILMRHNKYSVKANMQNEIRECIHSQLRGVITS